MRSSVSKNIFNIFIQKTYKKYFLVLLKRAKSLYLLSLRRNKLYIVLNRRKNVEKN